MFPFEVGDRVLVKGEDGLWAKPEDGIWTVTKIENGTIRLEKGKMWRYVAPHMITKYKPEKERML